MVEESSDANFYPQGDLNYEAQIAALEEETEQKVSHTMSAIETAVESWKAAGKKPESLRVQIVRLQRFYDHLIEWERVSLIEKKKDASLEARIRRLKKFVEICAEYKEAGG